MRRAYCCKIYSSMGLTRMPSLVDEMPLWHHQKGVEVFWHTNPECLHHRMSQGEVYKEKQRTSSKVAKGCKRHKTDQPVEPRHFYLQMPTLTNTHTSKVESESIKLYILYIYMIM